MNELRIDTEHLRQYVSDDEIRQISGEVLSAKKTLMSGNGKGNDFLGWVNLPEELDPQIVSSIKNDVARLAPKIKLFVVIGIGGSYLGARAVIEALQSEFAAVMNDIKGRASVFIKGDGIRKPGGIVAFDGDALFFADSGLQNFHTAWIVVVDDQRAGCGDQRRVACERFLNVVDVLVIIQVIIVDIQDHRDIGTQFEETFHVFTGFRDEELAVTALGRTADQIQDTADVDGGAYACQLEDRGGHGSRRGLSVCSGDADRSLILRHQLTKEHGALDDREPFFLCSYDLGIIVMDGCCAYDDSRACDVFRSMADKDRDAALTQMLDDRGVRDIRTADMIPFVYQNGSKAAHAGTADADHMHFAVFMLIDMFHKGSHTSFRLSFQRNFRCPSLYCFYLLCTTRRRITDPDCKTTGHALPRSTPCHQKHVSNLGTGHGVSDGYRS